MMVEVIASGRPYLLQAGRSDFHIHTYVSDGVEYCTPENIARVAENLGLREVGLTDHVMACGEGAKGHDHENCDTGPYFELCEKIRDVTSPVRLYVSWEVDYFDGGRYSFDPGKHLDDLDYVLLGHHYFRHMIDEKPQVIADYLVRIYMEMAREPYANIIAHPFYVPPPPERHGAILSRITDEQFSEFFQALEENGKAAEITAYQFSANLRDVAQSLRMYSVARKTGVKFTLDSDAHRLDTIGTGLRCVYRLADLGFTDDDFVDYEGLISLKETAH
jgi:histidinol phosphatase-like PHP family hydrolase